VFFNVIVALFSLGQSASYRESVNQAKVAAASVWDTLRQVRRIDLNLEPVQLISRERKIHPLLIEKYRA
jgi:hypothetical protein